MGLQQNDSPLIITILSSAFFQNRWVFSLFFFFCLIFFLQLFLFYLFLLFWRSVYNNISNVLPLLDCSASFHSTDKESQYMTVSKLFFFFFFWFPLCLLFFSFLLSSSLCFLLDLPPLFPHPPFPTRTPFLWFHLSSFTCFTSFFFILSLSLSLTIIVFLYVQKYTYDSI